MGIRDRLKSTARSFADRLGEPRKQEDLALDRYRKATEGLPADADPQGYRAVCRREGLGKGKGGTFRVHNERVAVFRIEDGLFAIDDACTHEDGPLGEGSLEPDDVVRCPYHGWRFSLRDGSCLTREDRGVSTWPVKEVDGVIWIGPRRDDGAHQRGGDHDDGLSMAPESKP
jgi:nitrite reductase/ring-hydroxylating ferredoxin subunit